MRSHKFPARGWQWPDGSVGWPTSIHSAGVCMLDNEEAKAQRNHRQLSNTGQHRPQGPPNNRARDPGSTGMARRPARLPQRARLTSGLPRPPRPAAQPALGGPPSHRRSAAAALRPSQWRPELGAPWRGGVPRDGPRIVEWSGVEWRWAGGAGGLGGSARIFQNSCRQHSANKRQILQFYR